MSDINAPMDTTSAGLAGECPALVELHAHHGTPDAEIARHIADCPRCRALLRELEDDSFEAGPVTLELPSVEVADRSTPSGTLQVGEIVTVASADVPGSLLVALVLGLDHDIARVAPIVASAELDGELGVLLPAKTPLGYESVVDVEWIGWVDAAYIRERFGAIPEALLTAVREKIDRPPVTASPDAYVIRREASLFFLPTIGDLYKDIAESVPAFDIDLSQAGWADEAIVALRRGAVDRSKVDPAQVARLFRLAKWASVGAPVERNTALKALRLALADPPTAAAGRSKTTSAMAFLAQMPGLSKRTLTADEYIDAVVRALDDNDH